MVTGEAPFNGESVYATMTKRLKTDPDPPSKYCSDCPGELDAIILKLMARDPEQRYQSGAAVVEALQQVASTYGYKMGAVAQSASKTVGPSVDPTSVDSSQGRVPVNREPSSDNSPLSGPSSATNAAHRAAATGGRDAPFAAAPRGKQATPPAEGGTEILSSGFVDFDEEREDEGSQELVSVDYQAPAAMAANRGPRIDSEDWERKESYSLVGREAARMRTLSKRYIEQEAEALAVSDIVALGVAAIVGIACGVFFLRLVAPSLLANIIF
jgi:hypothetical protein